MEALGNKPRHKQTKIRHNNKALWNVMGKFMMKYISSFPLEQNSGCSCRQAFIHYCGLHQVWGITEKLHLIWVLRVLWTCSELVRRCEKGSGSECHTLALLEILKSPYSLGLIIPH